MQHYNFGGSGNTFVNNKLLVIESGDDQKFTYTTF